MPVSVGTLCEGVAVGSNRGTLCAVLPAGGECSVAETANDDITAGLGIGGGPGTAADVGWDAENIELSSRIAEYTAVLSATGRPETVGAVDFTNSLSYEVSKDTLSRSSSKGDDWRS
jgi:hypothetical protein